MTLSLLESNERTVVLPLRISYPTLMSRAILTKIFLLDLMSAAGVGRRSSQMNIIVAVSIRLACSATVTGNG